jgi:hypothetical protein
MARKKQEPGIPGGLMRLNGEPRLADGREKPSPTDAEVVRELVIGRRLLVRATGEDLGFDLEAWISFLNANPEFGDSEYADPEIFELYAAPMIAHQKSAGFRRYIPLAEAAWKSGLEAGISHEDVCREKFERQRSLGRTIDKMLHRKEDRETDK